METIIDSKQAERLKKVCEKWGVKLPPYYVTSGTDKNGKVERLELNRWSVAITLIELLDWLPNMIPVIVEYDERTVTENLSREITSYKSAHLLNYKHFSSGIERPEQPIEKQLLIDALLELFIWTIENGYYKGIK